MKASDVMSTKVVTVRADTLARSVADTLLRHGISAVPVVDDNGAVIGIVSEGDLMPRNEAAREARRDWWLQMMSEGEDLHPDYLEFLKADTRTAQQMMVSPVVTADEGMELADLAELLFANKIKRVPVLREGRMVGIVSRADLLRSLASPGARRDPEPAPDDGSLLPVASDRLEALTRHKQEPAPAPHAAADDEFSAAAFLHLASSHEAEEEERRKQAKRLEDEKHHRQASQMLASHLTEETWQRMLSNARATAKKGEDEHMLLRFPAELCSDHGRAVNAPDPDWPTTLRGMAAEIFMRWKAELRPHGFSLHARVVDFPDGVPGDIGLFLSWGNADAGKH
ncbi:MAG: CBS domain-containing protein [Rhodopseudomonas sp.]|uniref:CBS domain-containing protein n=1 Tax=Rhodopseudomonas sp. TaxID=1078 RepID=UPI00183ECB4B|nr:CBS domain-containing protein [Rhodopseudomonas sp.]NVN85068.1 CBS domain-containing protein [Rhodopseudomonas sp.]